MTPGSLLTLLLVKPHLVRSPKGFLVVLSPQGFLLVVFSSPEHPGFRNYRPFSNFSSVTPFSPWMAPPVPFVQFFRFGPSIFSQIHLFSILVGFPSVSLGYFRCLSSFADRMFLDMISI